MVGFKALYGTLTDKNNPYKQTGADDLFVFPQRNGQPTSFLMGSTPYMELNVGIHNIFKLIHVEYVRRLNYHYENTHKDGVRFMVRMTF